MNTGAVADIFICDVPPVNVSPVEFVKSIAVAPDNNTVLEPKSIDLVFELFDNKLAAVKLLVLMLKEPAVKVKLLLIAKGPVTLKTKFGLLKETVLAVVELIVLTVTVPDPEFASKTALSAALDGGKAVPPAPPDDVDQWAVEEVSQVPVPPTQ